MWAPLLPEVPYWAFHSLSCATAALSSLTLADTSLRASSKSCMGQRQGRAGQSVAGIVQLVGWSGWQMAIAAAAPGRCIKVTVSHCGIFG